MVGALLVVVLTDFFLSVGVLAWQCLQHIRVELGVPRGTPRTIGWGCAALFPKSLPLL